MFLYAEEFATAAEAKHRYLELRIMLSDAGEKEAAVYNILYEGSRPVVAVVMPETPKVTLSGHKGRPVQLPAELWRSLLLRHEAGRRRGPHERRHDGGTYLGPGGEDAGSRN